MLQFHPINLNCTSGEKTKRKTGNIRDNKHSNIIVHFTLLSISLNINHKVWVLFMLIDLHGHNDPSMGVILNDYAI